MKTTLTKLACLLMAGLLLVPTLAACSTPDDDGSKTKDPDQTTAQVEVETNPVEDAINDLRGKINWQGQDFGILYCNDYESYRREVEAQANFTGESGNAVLNDAINDTLVVVGDTGGCNTYRGDLGGINARLLTDGVADGGHVGGNLVCRTIGTRGDAGLADNLKFVVHNTGGDVGAAQVDTDTIHKLGSPLFVKNSFLILESPIYIVQQNL